MGARVELQGTWPVGAPKGTVTVTRISDPADPGSWPDYRIDHADPSIVISAELLDHYASGNGHPCVSLTDGVLRMEAVNRTVIYRIGEYLPAIHAYAAEWPD